MADKQYVLTFAMSDGTSKSVQFTAPQGPKGETGARGATGAKGDKGDKGDTGAAGADYVLTTADKQEIVGLVDAASITAGDSNKLGGVAAESYPTKKLIWENASPTSNFAAQTLSFAASSYNYYAVISRSGSSNNFTIVCPGQSAYMMGFEGSTSRRIIGRDVYVNATGSGFKIDDAKSRDTYGGNSTVNNSELIPYRIYGLNL